MEKGKRRFVALMAAVMVVFVSGFFLACGGGSGGNGETAGSSPSSPATPPQFVNNSPFYVDPHSEAATQEAQWKDSDPEDAERMRIIATHPQAEWFGSWNTDVRAQVAVFVSAAKAAGKIPVLVAYNIPHLDCGSGGAADASAYQTWIMSFADGVGAERALVILEPDALADLPCLSAADRATRIKLIAFAVHTLAALREAEVYVDAGNSNWISAETMAGILKEADIEEVAGFSLNVSNFYTTDQSEQYGDSLSALVGGKHFVVDTSRNGNGSNGEWCNPPGRALGAFPATTTGDPLADALLWIKRPGESDGTCNGGPAAGTWWPSYAVALVTNAGY